MDFTIVITTFNRPQMLRRALASALRQTHDRYDILVVDDLSDVPVTLDAECGRMAAVVRAPRRLGFAGAVNFGAMHAKGRWLAFLDDDDEYEPDLLRRTYARYQAEPFRQFSWCSTTIVHYDGSDQPVRETIRSFPAQYSSDDDLISAATSVGSGYGFTVRSDTFQQLGGFDQSYWAIADTEFFFRLIAAGHRPIVVSQSLMRVHKHHGPRMTDAGSYRNRARQCEQLRIRYADLIDRHPALGSYIRNSIEQLTTMAIAVEARDPPEAIAKQG